MQGQGPLYGGPCPQVGPLRLGSRVGPERVAQDTSGREEGKGHGEEDVQRGGEERRGEAPKTKGTASRWRAAARLVLHFSAQRPGASACAGAVQLHRRMSVAAPRCSFIGCSNGGSSSPAPRKLAFQEPMHQ